MSTPYGDFESINTFLATRSYVVGYIPSSADATLVASVKDTPDTDKYPHLARWYRHIASFSDAEKGKFVSAECPMIGKAPEPVTNGAAKTAAAKDDDDEDDDDVDLFGSDSEDEAAEAEKAKRLQAYQEKKSKKPAIIAKSSIVLDVKPWDDETDMGEVEKMVRGIELDGLVWGASKLVAIGYGIQKLQIGCVVEDDKVGTDILEEKITGFEDHVQSMDVAAFQKI
ncbi:elongation factor 1-beta-like [Convolutriloba macropyga]|uniref:elongation factor 1-beta-like n=1 Tax=Convolutriloba macropyga TaxID=536237 RepID=UPI003F5215FD